MQSSISPGRNRFSTYRTKVPSILLVSVASWIFGAPTCVGQNASIRPKVGYDDTPFLSGGKWRVHDSRRPLPVVVVPPEPSTSSQPGRPPSDAVVLFDGRDLSKWQRMENGKPASAKWKVQDDFMEVVPGAGDIITKDSFGDCQLHFEWRTPSPAKGEGQGRGNSGIILMGRYEVQVLDSYENPTYADGQAGSVYGQYPPLVNAARKPGQWQTYDIVFEAPRFRQNRLIRPAFMTVFHNGVLVHHRRKVLGPMRHREVPVYQPHPAEGPLLLQNHGDPVRYRNIWIRRLKGDTEPWLVYDGYDGPGKGKHIVFVSGDEEYRSEEVCPMLAKILAVRHGFRCTVLFAIDPETGVIDPNNRQNIPGLENLERADLMIVFTRFRELPQEQMRYIVEYVHSGKPIIGLRTATHAFAYPQDRPHPFAHWSYDSSKWPGGFGKQVLGETWVSHHGEHRRESTRGVTNQELAGHPILRGAQDIWGPTDVYGIRQLPDDAKVLVYGQVLEGMRPTDAPVKSKKNDPMMPLAWTRNFTSESGKVARVFCTTMGASGDFESAGLRRLCVNACYWCLGIEDRIGPSPAVDYVGDYQPTFYGFHSQPGYWRGIGLRPQDLELEPR
jgi:hypothetical protein